MTPKEAIDKVKELLKATFGEQPAEQSFEAGKLADGTVIQYSALEPGGDIFVLGADGSQQPAPAGELELEDGSIIVVTEPGKIAEVKAKAEEPPAEEAMTETLVDYAPQITALEQENAALKSRLDALEKRNGAFQQMFQALHDAVAGLSKEDSDRPVDKPKQTIFTANKGGKEAALAKVAQALAKLK